MKKRCGRRFLSSNNDQDEIPDFKTYNKVALLALESGSPPPQPPPVQSFFSSSSTFSSMGHGCKEGCEDTNSADA
jgi:hypothetical protein